MKKNEQEMHFNEVLQRLLKAGLIKQDRKKKNTKGKPPAKKPLK